MNFHKLKNTLDKIISEYNSPGVDCVVYKNHREIFRYYAGMRDIENNISLKGDELYIIFSMTKMLTCTSALQLLEQDKISLDDKVSKYLPEFEKMRVANQELDAEKSDKIARGESFGEDSVLKNAEEYAENPITIKHLFTMSAGLDYDLGSQPIKDALEKNQTSTRELVRAISKTILGFEPGTRYRYSLCHDVLGAVVEVVSGMKLGEYMSENIFKPLGMNNTFFGVPKDEETLSRFAKRYSYDENRKPKLEKLECCYNLSDDYESGGAGAISTAEDYAIFLDALACGGVGKSGNRILKESTVTLMGTNHLEGQPLEDFGEVRPGYGYGLGVRTHVDPDTSGAISPVGEFGWDGAAGAFSMVDPKNNISLTFFQHIHGWKIEIQNMLKNALYKSLKEN